MSEDASPAIPAAKVELCETAALLAMAQRNVPTDVQSLLIETGAMRQGTVAALRAAAAYDAQQRAAAGPQPARERDTDAWWAD